MHAQQRLRFLLRRACTPGVLGSNQVGMAVHAVHQLGALEVARPSTVHNLLSIIDDLCAGADTRSQANILHSLAFSISDSLGKRTVVREELSGTVLRVQRQLTEQADTLTAPETVLVMEALLELLPYVGGDGLTSLVDAGLMAEVRERTMALATVVERPVDLLGVTRVAVAAVCAASAASSAPPSSEAPSVAATSAASAWASGALDHVLRVVHARLSTFSKQDLITLLDTLTVRLPTSSLNPTSARARAAKLLDPPSPSSGQGRTAEAVSNTDAATTVAVLDAGRPLLPDLLAAALNTVPALSTSQLCAWLQRLAALGLTDYPLLLAVLERLAAADVSDYTVPQLSTATGAIAEVLTAHASTVGLWVHAELCLSLYARLFERLATTLRAGDRNDPTVLFDAETRLLPLFYTVPEAALDDFVEIVTPRRPRLAPKDEVPLELDETEAVAEKLPGRKASTVKVTEALETMTTLATAIEAACAVLLRFMQRMSLRSQATVASFVFYWRPYTPYLPYVSVADDATDLKPSPLAFTLLGENDSVPLRAREALQRCTPLTLEETLRKHYALCGLLITCSAAFKARDVAQVLNEVALAEAVEKRVMTTRERLWKRQVRRPAFGDTAEDQVELPQLTPRDVAARKVRAQRVVLMKHLHAQLQGPLSASLGEVPTSSLVRYLSTISQLDVQAKAPYGLVLEALQSRVLSGAEYASVLGILARNHLKSRHIVGAAVRELPTLAASLTIQDRLKLLKNLGQVKADELVKAPCDPALTAGKFLPNAVEMRRLTMLDLVFAFNGLVDLRQFANPATLQILSEMNYRITAPTKTSKDSLASIMSATLLADLLVALCRFGGPTERVTPALMEETLRLLRRRLVPHRSSFVDLSRICWQWPLVVFYFQISSPLWNRNFGGVVDTSGAGAGASTPSTAAAEQTAVEQTATDAAAAVADAASDANRWHFTEEEWTRLRDAFAELCFAAGKGLGARLKDIAEDPTLRTNTFLWAQMACGVRFGSVPDYGTPEEERLVDHLEFQAMRPLLDYPQQLLDVLAVGLYLQHTGRTAKALQALRFVQRNQARLRPQDHLQVWWYADTVLDTRGTSCEATLAGLGVTNTKARESGLRPQCLTEEVQHLLTKLRDTSRTEVLDPAKDNVSKLGLMEQRLMEFLR